jgi:hypothetical protein
MLRVCSFLIVVTGCVMVYAGTGLSHGAPVVAQAVARVELHPVRTAESDLEVRELGQGGPRFVTRGSLEALPQVDAVIKPDENFTEVPKEGVKVRGVELEMLERSLGGGAATMAAEGVCSDGYSPAFPVAYVKRHHPIVVLTMDGMTPKAYAAKTHTSDLGPYFIAYDDFVPAFHVLSHADRSQVPVQMDLLVFAPERQMFAGLVPSSTLDGTAMQGYTIAQQNCFRCHNAGRYGGTKAGLGWPLLGKDASERPKWFAKWVHDPQSVDTKAEMPANPEYDRATLTALTQYFSTMQVPAL